jgi:hypothetical protein
MAGTVKYTISGGVPNYTASLTPSMILPHTHTLDGTYQFTNVPDGTYLLTVTDANDCLFEQTITVNPLVTTTTTTHIPNDSIIVGSNTNGLFIFDENLTNTNSLYVGSPDPMTVTVYLWFKTKDGNPLTSSKQMTYNIHSGVAGTQFTYNGVSDATHMIVNETVSGPASIIFGSISLQSGFIESFFAYTFKKIVGTADYDINLNGSTVRFDTEVPISTPTYLYGVNSISPTVAHLNFA